MIQKQWLIILGLLTCFLAACATTKDNTPPPSPLTSFTSSLTVHPLWSRKIGSGSGIFYLRMSPTIVGHVIYAADYSGRITALNMNSGQVIWQVTVGQRLTSGVSADHGKLFVATGQGGVVALSQSNGRVLWMTPVGNDVLATPIATRGRVIVQSIDGTVTALSQSDGRQIWHYTENMPLLILHAASQPQVVGNNVVVGFANGELAVLKLQSGRVRWQRRVAMPKGSTDIERMVDIDVNPVVVKGVVYVATYQGKIAAMDLGSGHVLWQHDISSYAGIAADYHHIYVADAKSHLWAFDPDSGAVDWRQAQLAYRMITGPAVVGNHLTVADAEGYLHFLSIRDGRFVARSSLNRAGVVTTPIVYLNKVFVLTRDGTLYAYQVGS